MATARQMLDVARSELGYKEGRGNDTKYGRWYHLNWEPWCAMFISWCANQAGVPTNVIPKHAYTPSGAKFFKRKKQWHKKNPQVGDIVYYNLAGLGRISHVGIVEEVHRKGWTAIEGNTDVRGGRTGGQVMRKRRRRTGWRGGFGRPAYAATKPGDRTLRQGTKGEDVKVLQRRIGASADGDFGAATAAALRTWQRKHGLEADGIAGPATWRAILAPEPATQPTPEPKPEPKPEPLPLAPDSSLSHEDIMRIRDAVLDAAIARRGSVLGGNTTLRAVIANVDAMVESVRKAIKNKGE